MQVSVDLSPVLGGNLVRLDAMRLKQLQNQSVYDALDKMGELSAKAMLINRPLTTVERLMANPNHTLYLMWEKDEDKPNTSYLLGMLKVGKKQLFLLDPETKSYNGSVQCVLDFYVHFSRQRQGIGHQLFEFMLMAEHTVPEKMALDNPSVTLLAFMSRHYQLDEPIWQNTNFVIFPRFIALMHGEDVAAAGADGPKAPDEWQRPGTPRHLNAGVNPLTCRIINNMSTAGNARGAAAIADLSTEGTLANKSQSAKQRKQHILSSKPLW